MSNTKDTEGNESQRKEPTLSSALGDMSSVIGGMRLKQHKNAIAPRRSNVSKKKKKKSGKSPKKEVVCDSPSASSQKDTTAVDNEASGAEAVEAAFTIDRSLIERAQRMAAAARAMPDPAKIMSDLQAKLGRINNPNSTPEVVLPPRYNAPGRTKPKVTNGRKNKKGKKKTKKGPNLMSAEDEQQLLARIKSLCADSPTAPPRTPSPITARSHVSAISSASPRSTQPRRTTTTIPPINITPTNGSPRSVRSHQAPFGGGSPSPSIKFTDKGGALDANNGTETNVGRKYLKRKQALNRMKRQKERREQREREAEEKQKAMLRQQHAEQHRQKLKKQMAMRQRQKQQKLREEQRIREEEEKRAREQQVVQAQRAQEMQKLARQRVQQRRMRQHKIEEKRYQQESEIREHAKEVHEEVSQHARRRAQARLRELKQRKEYKEEQQKLLQAQQEEEAARMRAAAEARRKETNASIRRMKRETRERLRKAQEQADRLQSKEAERIKRKLESRKAKKGSHRPSKNQRHKPKVSSEKKTKKADKNDLYLVVPSPTHSATPRSENKSVNSPAAGDNNVKKHRSNLDVSVDSLEDSNEDSENEFFIPLKGHDADDIGVIRYHKPERPKPQPQSYAQAQSVPVRSLPAGRRPSSRLARDKRNSSNKPRVRKKKVPVWKRVQPIQLSPASDYIAKATKGSYATAFKSKKKNPRKAGSDRRTRNATNRVSPRHGTPRHGTPRRQPVHKTFSGHRQSVSEGAIVHAHGKARRHRNLQQPQPHSNSSYNGVYNDLQRHGGGHTRDYDGGGHTRDYDSGGRTRGYDNNEPDPLSRSRSMGIVMRRNDKQRTVAESTRQRANELMNQENGYTRGSGGHSMGTYNGTRSPLARPFGGGRGHPVGVSNAPRQSVGRSGPQFRFNAKVVVRPKV